MRGESVTEVATRKQTEQRQGRLMIESLSNPTFPTSKWEGQENPQPQRCYTGVAVQVTTR